MTKFEVVSDIHLDRLNGTGEKGIQFIDSVLENPKAPTLLIAGDVGFHNDFHSAYFFDQAKRKYNQVLCVLGNHDYWGFDYLKDDPFKYWSDRFKADNIQFLSLSEPNPVKIESTIVIGGTLWSELDPVFEVVIQGVLNDFKAIKNFSLDDYQALHSKELTNLKTEIEKYKDEKTLILTHHAPTFKTTERWSESPIKTCFCTDLEKIIEFSPQIKAWVFGHCHEPDAITIGHAQVVDHSFGYYNDTNNNSYKPYLLEI